MNLEVLAHREHENDAKESNSAFSLCKVCGDRASGRHYGVLTCDGCRGFFKRSVRRNIEYSCKFQGVCVVDLKRRNQCQSCRYQRCLRAGMNRHSVQHERIPRKQRFNQSSLAADGIRNMIPISMNSKSDEKFHLQNNKQSEYNQVSQLPKYHQTSHLEFPKENRPPVQSSKKRGYTIESLLEVAKKEQTRYVGRSADISPTTPPESPTVLGSYYNRIHETLHKILQSACFWPYTVSTFYELPNGDKTKLLDEGWTELLVLGLLECDFSLAVLSDYLRNFVYVFKTKEDLQKIEKFELVLQKLKCLVIDSNEMAFLKAIAVFKPYVQSLVMRQHVENLQDQAQILLGDYIRQRYPGNTARFGKLILSLQLLRSIDQQMLRNCLQQPCSFYFPGVHLDQMRD